MLDIGLVIEAQNTAVSEIRLAIPFGTETLQDLSEHVLNAATAELIFDADVTVPAQTTIHFNGKNLSIAKPALQRCSRETEYCSKDFSVWTIPLSQKIQPGTRAYLRIRFDIVGTGATWQWQRQHGSRTGALVDLRFCDLRGTATVPGGDELSNHIQPIDTIYAFVMVPSWLRARTASPDTRYVRLLEGAVWQKYLGRSPEILAKSRLVVYSWKGGIKSQGANTPQVGLPVDRANPMRAYADFSLARKPRGLVRTVVTAILSALIVGLTFKLQMRDTLTASFDQILQFLQGVSPQWSFAGIGAVVIFWISKEWKPAVQSIGELKNLARRLEAAFFKKIR